MAYRGYAEDMGQVFKEGNNNIIRGYNISHNRRTAQGIADQRTADAQAKGYVLTGYEPYTLRSNKKGGTFEDTRFDMPIYRAPFPAPAPPPPAPAPAPAPVAEYVPKTLPTAAPPPAPDYSKYEEQVASLSNALKGLQGQLSSNSAAYAKSIADYKNTFAASYNNQNLTFEKTLGDQAARFNNQIKNLNTKFDDNYAAQSAGFKSAYDAQQAGFEKNLSAQQAAFDANLSAQNTKYDNNMKSLRNSLAANSSRNSNPVLGIKSAGNKNFNQIQAMQRQGMKGTFGRSGLRIKGIKDKSLNI